MAMSALPSVLVITQDKSEPIHLSTKSSEEENLNEKLLDIEILFSDNHLDAIDGIPHFAEEFLIHFDKNYTIPCLNILSPPPDFQFL